MGRLPGFLPGFVADLLRSVFMPAEGSTMPALRRGASAGFECPWAALMQEFETHVFVIGCGHTGTTLIAAMLGAHPSIYSIPKETRALVHNTAPDQARASIERAAADCAKPGATHL